jgi:radical SAM protein with 4Fe4S-binding SPASM domain
MSFPRPKYVQLYPTTRCNQGCSFCFNAPCEQTADMPHESALRLLDILSGQGIGDLDIMGGEPFLIEWIPDFIATAARRGVRVNISTNGSRPEIMRRLAGMTPATINVGVSLEGSTAEAHNVLTRSHHFSLAMKSIRTLVALGLNPIVKTVVNRTTLRDIENIVALIGDLGVRRYYLIHMDVMAKNPSLLNESLRYADFVSYHEKIKAASARVGIFRVNASCFAKENLPPGTRCAGGVLKLSIMPDGSAYPCNLFHQNGEFRLGNIFAEGITPIWRSSRLSFFRTFAGNTCGLDDCKNRAACTGGCPAHGCLHFSDPDAEDIRCAIPIEGVQRLVGSASGSFMPAQ